VALGNGPNIKECISGHKCMPENGGVPFSPKNEIPFSSTVHIPPQKKVGFHFPPHYF